MMIADTSVQNPVAAEDAPSTYDCLRVHCVIFEKGPDRMERAMDYLSRAAEHAIAAKLVGAVDLAYGDCSPKRTFSSDELDRIASKYPGLRETTVTFFNKNLGSAAAHNRLLSQSSADLTLILNPDVLVAPDLLIELIRAIRRPKMGLVEGRQIPCEHPKDFDPETGETSWCSTACLLALTRVLKEVGGFDSDTFFLYGDDVDMSWRVRLAGYAIAFQPTANCFHDKRLSGDAQLQVGAAEHYFSAEAGLLLSYKYSRSDLSEKYLAHFANSDDPEWRRAAAAFEERRQTGRLPAQLDPEHKVAQFFDGDYAKKRFQPR
jgi:Glycosyl transferase family 2